MGITIPRPPPMGGEVINNVYTWFCTNKLSLNAGKTKYIITKPRQRHCDISGRNISINNVSLTRIGNNCSETSTKFLGILIDENLSWKQHISYLNSKISKTLFTIKQVKHFLPYDSLKKLYSTLVESHLSYGIMAWGNASESTKYKTLLLQKRAIRAINKANYNSHTEPLFKRSKILKLNDLYQLKVILFVNDFIANKLPNECHLITSSHLTMNVQILETRVNQIYFIKKGAVPIFFENMPLYNFPKIWNKWSYVFSDQRISRSHLKYSMMASQFLKYAPVVTCSNKHCKDCRKS